MGRVNSLPRSFDLHRPDIAGIRGSMGLGITAMHGLMITPLPPALLFFFRHCDLRAGAAAVFTDPCLTLAENDAARALVRRFTDAFDEQVKCALGRYGGGIGCIGLRKVG